MKNLLTLLLISLSLLTYAQHKRNITSEDLWRMKKIGSLDISPDGKSAVFVITQYDFDENKSNSDLYLLNLSTKETIRLTNNKSNESSPKWSPDGKQIAFLAKRDDDKAAQLYILKFGWGEPERITDIPSGVSNIQWSKDGSKVFFAANVLPNTNIDFASLKKDLEKRKDKKVTARVTEDRFYRYWDHWLPEDYVTQIFSIDLKSKEYKNYTPQNTRILSFDGSGAEFDLSPDGNWIAISANNTKPPYMEPFNQDIFLVKTDGKGEFVNITAENLATDNSPKFSPDGNRIYYGENLNVKLVSENIKLVYYDINSKTKKRLTSNIDLSFNDWFFSSDGKSIFLTAEQKARTGIFKIDFEGNGFKKLFADGTSSSIKEGLGKLFFFNENLSSPPTLISLDEKTANTSLFLNLNKLILDSLNLGKVEEHYFVGAGGDSVQMYMIYPPDFSPEKKYGLLHIIHGGPHNASMDSFHPRWNGQRFAAMGYITVMVNFHGSSGFGEKFCQSILGTHGDKPYTDIMNATDFLINKFNFIDSKKLAAAGGSYGGYLVNWIATQTDRFSALITHAGVYNFSGQFASDMTHFRELAYGGSPWSNSDAMMKYSPSAQVEKIITPILIIHGEKDYRVVVTQGLELYACLKGKGVPSRLIYFPDENHWVLSGQNSIFWYKEFDQWLKRYLN